MSRFRTWYALSSGNISRAIYTRIRSHSWTFSVFSCQSGILDRLKDFTISFSDEPYIILSDRLNDMTARIVCAHELGHHMLHQRFAQKLLFGEYDLYLSHIRWEAEANEFAAHFLIPDALLAEVLSSLPAPDIGVSMDELAHQCDTTQQLMAIKLGQAERPVVFPDGSVKMQGM